MALEVLNLVGKGDSPPFRMQIEGLERLGVDSTVISVPSSDGSGSRGVSHYAKFHLQTLASARRSYDIVHANYGLTAPAAIMQPRRPVVLSLWGSDLMGEYGWVSQWCAKHCDAVIVMSGDMAAKLDTTCHVIPHGIDLERFAPRDQRAAQRELDWDPDRKHVLFPYSPERTVKDYPRAKRIVDEVDEAVSVPVDLRYVTGVDHDRIPVYMNAADVLLLTSRREGSPNVVKEAMACNLPVVATDVGDVREQLEDVSPSAVCTSDAEFVDTLISILDRGDRSNGRRSVTHLSNERMCERILGVYEAVLGDEHSPQTCSSTPSP